MAVKIVGLNELHSALVDVQKNLGEVRRVAPEWLERDMNKFAHVITGYMKSTLYHKYGIAGADAYYAGFEADRGGEHDYAGQAIEAFNWDRLADFVVEPF